MIPRGETPGGDVIEARLRAVLREFSATKAATGQSSLAEEHGLDSVLMLAFITRVEKVFGVSIGGREIENDVLTTFGNLLSFLRQKESSRNLE